MTTAQPKTLFLVGASGYVGGEILSQLLRFSPAFTIAASFRTQAQADKLSTVHPSVRTVIGDLDSHDLLVTEASNAVFIIQTAKCDHDGILSLLEGISKSKRGAKPFIIQMSGAGSLIDPAVPYGHSNPVVLSDHDDQDAIIQLPTSRQHVPTERKIYAKAEQLDHRVVVIVPGQIFGRGDGVFETENKLIMTTCWDAFVKQRLVWTIDDGSCAWGWTSVKDLGRATMFLLSEAMKHEPETKLGFGPKAGIHFVGTGEVLWKDRAEHLVKRLEKDGVVIYQRAKVISLAKEKSAMLEPNWIVQAIMGTSSRYRADRLKDLGFEPQE